MASFVVPVVSLLGVYVFCLLDAAHVSVTGLVANRTLRKSDDGWVAFDSEMKVGRAYSAVVWINGSLVIVGGCTDLTCTQRVNAIDIVDPGDQVEPRHMELPIKLGGKAIGEERKGNTTMLTLAGATSAVRVDDVGDENSSRVYVVGACSYYYPERDGPFNSPLVREQYSGIWALSSDLTGVVSHYSIGKWDDAQEGSGSMGGGGDDAQIATVLRANATCASRGHLLFIVGGVNMATGDVVSAVDVYDTQRRRYYPGVFNLTTAVRNPLVAFDNALMYVVGGEVFRAATLGGKESESLRGCSEGHWCPTPTVQVIMLVKSYQPVTGDDNSKSNNSLLGFLIPGVPCNTELSFPNPSGRHMFTFNGKLCVAMNSSFVNCLDIENFFNHLLPRGGNNSSDDVWTPLAYSRSVPPTEVSTPFSFPLSTGVLGATLVFFNIGGFDAGGTPSRRLFYRTSDVVVTSVSETRAVLPFGIPINFTLRPPRSGFVRLSSNLHCTDNVAGTTDIRVAQRKDEATVAVFHPVGEAARVFVCFANGPVSLPCVERGCPALVEVSFLYTPITFTAFSIRREVVPQPPESPNHRWIYTLGTIVGCLAAFGVVAMMALTVARPVMVPAFNEEHIIDLLPKEKKLNGSRVSIRKEGIKREFVAKSDRGRKKKAAAEASGSPMSPRKLKIGGDCSNITCELDMVVRNTTRDSRYEVVRRIGEGAFSSVYLVKHKHSKQQFALKYLVCRDDKERADALRECETINSLQGHPNIIRIVEMFMNYEFIGDRESCSVSQALLAHTVAPPCLLQQNRDDGATAAMKADCLADGTLMPGAREARACTEFCREGPVAVAVPDTGRSVPHPTAAAFAHTLNLRTFAGADNLTPVQPSAATALSERSNGIPAGPRRHVSTPLLEQCDGAISSNLVHAPREVYTTSRPNGPTPSHVPITADADGAVDPNQMDAVVATPAPAPHTPNHQQTVTIHYPNFAQPVDSLPLLAPHQHEIGHTNHDLEPHVGCGTPVALERTSYAPRSGVHYKDFDVTLCASGVARSPQRFPTTTPVVRNYVQPAVGRMQYTNFAAENFCAPTPVNSLVAAVSRPKSVADAVRAARLQKDSPTRVMTTEINTSSKILADHIRKVGHNSSTQPVVTYQPTPTVQQRRGSRDDADVLAQHRDIDAPGADKPLYNAINKAREQPVQQQAGCSISHSRYLGLVMEYHPLGDLCGYAIRHAAIHNPKVRSQIEKDKLLAACAHENKIHKREEDSRSGAHVVPSEDKGAPHSLDLGAKDLLDQLPCGSNAVNAKAQNTTSSSNVGKDMNDIFKMLDSTFVMRENPFTEPQLLSIAYQLSSVLDHLHSQRPPIVHRDLKPENILIYGNLLGSGMGARHGCSKGASRGGCTDGDERRDEKDKDGGRTVAVEVRGDSPTKREKCVRSTSRSGCPTKLATDVIPIVVTDFGLAFVLKERRKMGRGGGTRPYIAPECWVGQTSTASDMWSLGCVLYALATARVTVQTVRLMYEEAEREGFAAMVMNDILSRGYSLEFASFVLSLLVANPERRPTARMAMQCFELLGNNSEVTRVQFDPKSPFFSNVQGL